MKRRPKLDDIDTDGKPQSFKRQINSLKRKTPLRRNAPIKRKHKFNAERSEGRAFPEIAGRPFPSRLEREVATDLCVRLHADEIEDLRFQHTVHLSDAAIPWKIDFSYIENGVRIFHEAKGCETEGYRLKRKLFLSYGEGPLRITKGSWGNKTTRVYYPKKFLRKDVDE